jgi:hypothetical protein
MLARGRAPLFIYVARDDAIRQQPLARLFSSLFVPRRKVLGTPPPLADKAHRSTRTDRARHLARAHAGGLAQRHRPRQPPCESSFEQARLACMPGQFRQLRRTGDLKFRGRRWRRTKDHRDITKEHIVDGPFPVLERSERTANGDQPAMERRWTLSQSLDGNRLRSTLRQTRCARHAHKRERDDNDLDRTASVHGLSG